MLDNCDHSLSIVVIVARLSVHNFFKHLLLNHWASFNQISQDWSLSSTDSKLFEDLEIGVHAGF